MRKIFTIRNIDAQREHMWNARRIEEEVAACPRRRIAGYFIEYLPKGEPILEAGCGLGAWVIFLGDLGYDIAGIDHDARVIGRLKEWRPSLNVSAGDIRELPFGTESIGAVISLGVMEHFEEGCDEAMRETWRVLRPGGALLAFAITRYAGLIYGLLNGHQGAVEPRSPGSLCRPDRPAAEIPTPARRG